MDAATVSPSPQVAPPTRPGFYKYSGGNNVLIFLLDALGQWWAITDSAQMEKCVWGYIEQALGVWNLEKI